MSLLNLIWVALVVQSNVARNKALLANQIQIMGKTLG